MAPVPQQCVCNTPGVVDGCSHDFVQLIGTNVVYL
jgi:hypothetical protein